MLTLPISLQLEQFAQRMARVSSLFCTTWKNYEGEVFWVGLVLYREWVLLGGGKAAPAGLTMGSSSTAPRRHNSCPQRLGVQVL